MWQAVVVVLALILAVVLVRFQRLKREMSQLAADIESIGRLRSNRQLTIGMQQPQLARLASAVNGLYNEMDAEKAVHSEAMNEMRQSMANISHDLRTPLTSILGYLKLLRGGENTPEQQRRYLDVAYQKAGSLNRLVGGLFELARLESGGYVFQHQKLDAAALLGEELAGIYTQMEKKGLRPEVLLPETPLWIIGDKGAVARIFANLLHNMAKHGTNPMLVSAGEENSRAVFRFCNAAPGLTGQDAQLLFQRFFIADRMRSGENTGLGLSIVKEFVQQMEGDVSARLADGALNIVLSFPLVG